MRRLLAVALAGVACLLVHNASETKIVGKHGDVTYSFFGNFRPETIVGKNTVLLNDANCGQDKVWFARHVLDLGVSALCGSNEGCDPMAEFFVSLRNKAVWGSPGTNASTNEATLKLDEAVFGTHKHTFPRHIFWMREGWLQFDIGRLLGLPFDTHHFFKIGAFPFVLGRGIALGSAYAIGPEILGFYIDTLVDQFAFGANVSGDVIHDKLLYDLYASIWDNKSASTSDTNAKIYAQEYGRIANPARGFGNIAYTIAVRLDAFLMKNKNGCTMRLEPYAVFNSQPEQKIEFLGDASSRLGTIGLAFEYGSPRGEWGFDTAFNLGHQKVRGWDRNSVIPCVDAATGNLSICNSHVVTTAGGTTQVPFTKSGDRQPLIRNTLQDESENGLKIGTDDTGQDLYNATDRFRDGYTNKYKGWMFVADACTAPLRGCIKLGAGIGIASGDDNPNEVTKDGDFKGFIGLQEAYVGKKIRSAFLLGSANKVVRPLSLRNPNRQPGRFARNISRFSNIGFAGASLIWNPEREHEIMIHPNIIGYWQPHATKKFDAVNKVNTDEDASSNLGIEVNTFAYYVPMPCLKLDFLASIFLPGQHYSDIKGTPINKEQQKALDRLDKTGFDGDRIPNVGDDRAYTFTFGINYLF